MKKLYGEIWEIEKTENLTLRITKILSFALLLGISAKIKIPFTPVPFTFQTLVIFVMLFLLREDSFFSVATYLVMGALGIPLFAFGGGLTYFFSPTGGYLMGFLLAALVIGHAFTFGDVVDNGFAAAVLFTIALTIIYGSGILWLVFVYHLTFEKALIVGFLPFAFPELVKMTCALIIFKAIKR